MKTHFPLALLAISASTLGAQTAPKPATGSPVAVHHTTAAGAVRLGGCVPVPAISPKIPALPAGAPCAKALYTLTKTPDTKLDYVSPLVAPDVRAGLSSTASTYSLLYIDTKIGTGELGHQKMWYTVHYTGYLPDGSKFDSSVDRGEPISFPYGGHRVIQGWDTGFEGMHVGGKRRLFVPYQLAYGEAGRPPVIPAKAVLIFDVELISQSENQPAPKAPPAPPTPPAGSPAPKPSQPAEDKPTTTPAPSSNPVTSTPPPDKPAATVPKQ
jgi:peptidylprolyl isomerase